MANTRVEVDAHSSSVIYKRAPRASVLFRSSDDIEEEGGEGGGGGGGEEDNVLGCSILVVVKLCLPDAEGGGEDESKNKCNLTPTKP